jgi:hypothetical protein
VAVAATVPVLATLGFASSAMAWSNPVLQTACVPGQDAFNLKITATDTRNQSFSKMQSATVGLTLDGVAVDTHQSFRWNWDSSNTSRTQVVFDQNITSDAANPSVNGNWTVALAGLPDILPQSFQVSGCGSGAPAPTPSPFSTSGWNNPVISTACIPDQNGYVLTVTATDTRNQSFSNTQSGTVTFWLNGLPVNSNQSFQWNWDNSNANRTQVVFNQTVTSDAANPTVNGNWMVNLGGLSDIVPQSFQVSGCGATAATPSPSPSPSPASSTSSAAGTTSTSAAVQGTTPGLPLTGVA